MLSPDTAPAEFGPGERTALLAVAAGSVRHGLEQGVSLPVDPADHPRSLRSERATFVTLKLAGNLRGCIGHLEAFQPLVADVSENAFAAAFRDPRFPPLRADELTGLELHVSVLTPAEPIEFGSEAELLEQLRPGIDGLVLKAERQRGTFLPSVWESLPDPHAFLEQLKLKAGLPSGFWSDEIEVQRYRTESFAAPFARC